MPDIKPSNQNSNQDNTNNQSGSIAPKTIPIKQTAPAQSNSSDPSPSTPNQATPAQPANQAAPAKPTQPPISTPQGTPPQPKSTRDQPKKPVPSKLKVPAKKTHPKSARPNAPTAQPTAPAQPQQGPNAPGLNDPYGYGGSPSDGSFGGGFGPSYGGFGGSPGYSPYGSQGQGSQPQKRLTPEERVQMIKKVYAEILGREPDTRDINYYKYSTLNEEQVKKQLLSSTEHKELTKKGRDFDKIKSQTGQLQTRCKMLEGQIKDQLEEFKQLNLLLKEKNQYIQELREEKGAYPKPGSPDNVPQCVQSPQGRVAQDQEQPHLKTTTPPQEIPESPQLQTGQPVPTAQPTTGPTALPPVPAATFTNETTPSQPKNSSRIKELVTQFLSQFF